MKSDDLNKLRDLIESVTYYYIYNVTLNATENATWSATLNATSELTWDATLNATLEPTYSVMEEFVNDL